MSNRVSGLVPDFLERGCRPIPGFDGYYVNEAGDVFSVMKLSPFVHGDGYVRVTTFAGRVRARPGVATLVAHAFIGPRPPGMQLRHLDGDRLNNHPSNLAWGTVQENADDRARHGTCRGEKNANAKLTERDVRRIVALFRSRKIVGRDARICEIARQFGVVPQTIRNIVEGRSWKSVTSTRGTTAATRAKKKLVVARVQS